LPAAEDGRPAELGPGLRPLEARVAVAPKEGQPPQETAERRLALKLVGRPLGGLTEPGVGVQLASAATAAELFLA